MDYFAFDLKAQFVNVVLYYLIIDKDNFLNFQIDQVNKILILQDQRTRAYAADPPKTFENAPYLLTILSILIDPNTTALCD
jgi:hypothetical protein